MNQQPQFGVIFDMDGVLVDSYESHFITWRDSCRRHGRDCTEAEFLIGFGRTSREFIRETWENPPDDQWIAAFDAEKEQRYRDHITLSFPAMPGARELIHALHSAGIPMAIGSSGPPENVHEIVRQLQVDEQIRVRISGADVVRGKPHPDVFLKAAAGIGIPPARCVVLEDAPVGVEAALAAGMKCLGVISAGRTAAQLEHAHQQVHDNLLTVTVDLLRTLAAGDHSKR